MVMYPSVSSTLPLPLVKSNNETPEAQDLLFRRNPRVHEKASLPRDDAQTPRGAFWVKVQQPEVFNISLRPTEQLHM
jgi:hypothetical protein